MCKSLRNHESFSDTHFQMLLEVKQYKSEENPLFIDTVPMDILTPACCWSLQLHFELPLKRWEEFDLKVARDRRKGLSFAATREMEQQVNVHYCGFMVSTNI